VRKRRAPSFRRDPISEAILKMRRTDPRGYELLLPATKLQALGYEAGKREAGLHASEKESPNKEA
jgi:hypothetical protein